MPRRIATAAGVDLDEVRTVRCILDSLAGGYARTIDRAVALTGAEVDVVHIVGGGSQNELLCRLTAAATGRPVVAGPVEATVLGNVAVQARALGGRPATWRRSGRASPRPSTLRRYEPT